MNRITITSNDLLSIDEAKDILSISRVHIWRLMKANKLQPIYFGNRPYFARNQVIQLRKERKDA